MCQKTKWTFSISSIMPNIYEVINWECDLATYFPGLDDHGVIFVFVFMNVEVLQGSFASKVDPQTLFLWKNVQCDWKKIFKAFLCQMFWVIRFRFKPPFILYWFYTQCYVFIWQSWQASSTTVVHSLSRSPIQSSPIRVKRFMIY